MPLFESTKRPINWKKELPVQEELLGRTKAEGTMDAGSVIDLNSPPKVAYEYREYPKLVYHPDGGQKIVNSREDEAKLSKEWVNKPFPIKVAEVPEVEQEQDPEIPIQLQPKRKQK